MNLILFPALGDPHMAKGSRSAGEDRDPAKLASKVSARGEKGKGLGLKRFNLCDLHV